MKKMLITGGGGWLSGKLISYYYEDYEITALLRDEEKKWKLERNWKKLKFIFHDLQYPITKDYGEFDVVIHCAAQKHITTEILNPLLVYRCNVIGTGNIVDYCLTHSKKSRFIYISTDKALEPINRYGQSKKDAEKIVADSGLNHAIVRMGNLWASSGSFVNLLILKKIWGENEFDISSEKSERYFLTANDACQLIDSAVNGDEKYYIGTYKSVNIKHMVEVLFPGCKINIVGLRPGEKLEEILDNGQEKVYYSDDEIIDMFNESIKTEFGDRIS